MKLTTQKNEKTKKETEKEKSYGSTPPYCKSVKTNIGKKFLKIMFIIN